MNKIKELYHYSLMNNKFLFLIPLLEYIIFPEFRKKDYKIKEKIIKHLKFFAFASLVYSLFVLFFSNTQMEKILIKKEAQIGFHLKRINFLKIHAFKLFYKQAEDSLKNSDDYIRYSVYKETGKIIPNKLPVNYLKLLISKSKENKIPLKIYLNTIERESGYDSLAKNPNSTAFSYMQVTKNPFNYYYDKLKLEGGHTPENNLIIGTYMLAEKYNNWQKIVPKNKAIQYAIASYALGDSIFQYSLEIPEKIKPYINYILK